MGPCSTELSLCSSGPYPAAPTTIFTPFTPAERTLATEAIGYWTSFARGGDPSIRRPLRTSPHWGGFAEGRLRIEEGVNGDTSSVMEQRTTQYEARCRFWNEIGPEIGL
jgi:hypothetical protein